MQINLQLTRQCILIAGIFPEGRIFSFQGSAEEAHLLPLTPEKTVGREPHEMKKSGKIFLHAEADRNYSPDVAQHWIFLYAELESVKSECDQATPYGQLFLNLKKEKVTDMTFRFADENDCSVILSFIKALADYEKMTEQVVATEEPAFTWRIFLSSRNTVGKDMEKRC